MFLQFEDTSKYVLKDSLGQFCHSFTHRSCTHSFTHRRLISTTETASGAQGQRKGSELLPVVQIECLVWFAGPQSTLLRCLGVWKALH